MAKKDAGYRRINRVYRCTYNQCGGKFSVDELAKDPWRKKCPFCNKRSLILDSATLDIDVFVDLAKPKTVGALAEKNRKQKIEEGVIKIKKQKLPWWRKDNKKNFNILKNPAKYVREGYV